MNFASALFTMQRGHRVRRSLWSGYWYIKDGELIIHTKEGEELNIRDTKDMMYTLSNIACDDWEVADEYMEKKKDVLTKSDVKDVISNINNLSHLSKLPNTILGTSDVPNAYYDHHELNKRLNEKLNNMNKE